MKLLALNEVEQKMTGFTHKVNLTFADLTAAATTQSINILPTGTKVFAAGFGIMRAAIRLITPFAGPSVTAVALDIGDGSSVGRYIANANTDLLTALATNTKPHVVSTTGFIYSPKNITDGYTNIIAKFTATGANVSVMTAGEVDVYLSALDFTGFARPAAS